MRVFTITAIVALGFLPFIWTNAASLLMVRDLVSTSVKSAPANHTIQFTITNAIPASGQIVITPAAGEFTIPVSFDYTDVDFATSTGASFTEGVLGATATATDEGVSVVTGTSGSITITLNSSAGLPAGTIVRVLLGTHAVTGEAGDQQLVNPSATGSYRMTFQTKTSGGGAIDDAGTRIAIVEQVAVDAVAQPIPPVRSNGLPSGEISFNNSTIEISLNTNEIATCRYATTTDVVYSSMTNQFTSVGGFLHTKTVAGHVNGASYDYYVRCADLEGTENDDDYAISFNLKDDPPVNTSTGEVGSITPGSGGGGGGAGAFTNGSQSLFLSSVILSGYTAPLASITLLKDGVQEQTLTASANGTFSASVSNLERGSYTFSLFATDRNGSKSSPYTSTITVVQGTSNTISNIVIPPTVSLSKNEVAIGEDIEVSGATVPGASVRLSVTPQGSSGNAGSAREYTASSTVSSTQGTPGSWRIVVPGPELSRGTYSIRARSTFESKAVSNPSAAVFVGVGEAAVPNFSGSADITGDGKINLIDFSIMLTVWGTSDPRGDLNQDGTVGLADFSILLFNWTG